MKYILLLLAKYCLAMSNGSFVWSERRILDDFISCEWTESRFCSKNKWRSMICTRGYFPFIPPLSSGWESYIERYGSTMSTVFATLKGPADWSLAGPLVQQMRERIPLETLEVITLPPQYLLTFFYAVGIVDNDLKYRDLNGILYNYKKSVSYTFTTMVFIIP